MPSDCVHQRGCFLGVSNSSLHGARQGRPAMAPTHCPGLCVPLLPRESSMDEIFQLLDELKVCNHCKIPLIDTEMGDKCPCCGKLTSERELRDSTVHSLVDYAGMDPEPEISAEPCSPEEVSDSTSTTFTTSPSKRVCNHDSCPRGVHITVRNTFGHPRFAGAEPNLNALTPADKASVIKGTPPFARESSLLHARDSTTAPVSGITIGEDVDSVCEEFRQRLLAFGYKDGERNDGVTFKYPAYLRMLFQSGIFSTRSDLFAVRARQRAHFAYKAMAHEKYKQSSGKTRESKFFNNFCHGFDDFVRLAPAPEPEPEEMTEDDIAALLA